MRDEPLKSLWMDEEMQEARERGKEVAVPDNHDKAIRVADPLVSSLAYFFSSLDRFFDPAYVPLEQDILRSTARTTGINETEFYFKGHQMLIVDEREEEMDKLLPGWDVTSILFFVSLSGYDQCLVEDREELFASAASFSWHGGGANELNPPQYFDGPPRDTRAGTYYFKRKFANIAQTES
ncbi:hypothetical protein H0H92_008963 [Tricholoma furcatifolium]|nr:hypothetical protein H0H92_008963 [Tricholoma furcatifolium]